MKRRREGLGTVEPRAQSVQILVHGGRAPVEGFRVDLGFGGRLERVADPRDVRGHVELATPLPTARPSSS